LFFNKAKFRNSLQIRVADCHDPVAGIPGDADQFLIVFSDKRDDG
jgi:hypothetical protein